MDKPIPLELARQKMLEAVLPTARTEALPLMQALGRTLKDDLLTPIDLPPFRSSAMDGYAFAKSGRHYRCVGASFAGKPFAGTLKPHECVRVFTGAVLPEGTDTVAAQEITQAAGEKVYLKEDLAVGTYVRPAGRDYQTGALLLAGGSRINPANIALLASVGVTEVLCAAPVKVALVATGDELIQGNQPLREGCIYESSLPMLKSLLATPVYQIVRSVCLPDQPQQIKSTLRQFSEEVEAIISIGGASVGESDFIRAILEQEGRVDFWRIALKPGMPMLFGQIGQSVFFGLPGNPVSTFVTFTELVAPCLAKMSGTESPKPHRFYATLSTGLSKDTQRVEFQRGWLDSDEEGNWVVHPVANQSSNSIKSLATANCYIILDSKQGDMEAEERVLVQPLYGFF